MQSSVVSPSECDTSAKLGFESTICLSASDTGIKNMVYGLAVG